MDGRAWCQAAVVVAALLLAGDVTAGTLTGISQNRVVQSTTTDATTGFECFDPIFGPPLLGCPVDLGTTVSHDPHAAVDFGLFSATAATAGGSASQESEIGPTLVRGAGSANVNATASAPTQPPYLLITRFVDPETEDDFEVSVSLDAPTAFRLDLSGSILYPDPAFPVGWNAALSIQVNGPAGSVASFSALPDFGCLSDPNTLLCTVTPAPVSITGILEPGTYSVDVSLVTAAQGTYLRNVGPVGSSAGGDYSVELLLLSPVSVPALTPYGLGFLVLALALPAVLVPRILGSPRSTRRA